MLVGALVEVLAVVLVRVLAIALVALTKVLVGDYY